MQLWKSPEHTPVQRTFILFSNHLVPFKIHREWAAAMFLEAELEKWNLACQLLSPLKARYFPEILSSPMSPFTPFFFHPLYCSLGSSSWRLGRVMGPLSVYHHRLNGSRPLPPTPTRAHWIAARFHSAYISGHLFPRPDQPYDRTIYQSGSIPCTLVDKPVFP